MFFGSVCRYVADRRADMDVLQGNVKEEKGLSIYKHRYQVDVYIHIYLPGGATPPLRSLGNTLELDVFIHIYLLGGATPPLRSVGNTLHQQSLRVA